MKFEFVCIRPRRWNKAAHEAALTKLNKLDLQGYEAVTMATTAHGNDITEVVSCIMMIKKNGAELPAGLTESQKSAIGWSY